MCGATPCDEFSTGCFPRIQPLPSICLKECSDDDFNFSMPSGTRDCTCGTAVCGSGHVGCHNGACLKTCPDGEENRAGGSCMCKVTSGTNRLLTGKTDIMICKERQTCNPEADDVQAICTYPPCKEGVPNTSATPCTCAISRGIRFDCHKDLTCDKSGTEQNTACTRGWVYGFCQDPRSAAYQDVTPLGRFIGSKEQCLDLCVERREK